MDGRMMALHRMGAVVLMNDDDDDYGKLKSGQQVENEEKGRNNSAYWILSTLLVAQLFRMEMKRITKFIITIDSGNRHFSSSSIRAVHTLHYSVELHHAIVDGGKGIRAEEAQAT